MCFGSLKINVCSSKVKFSIRSLKCLLNLVLPTQLSLRKLLISEILFFLLHTLQHAIEYLHFELVPLMHTYKIVVKAVFFFENEFWQICSFNCPKLTIA